MPTLACVPILVRSHTDAIAQARTARDAGADLVEFRIDGFFRPNDDTSADEIESIVRESPLPCIITCRAAAEGGFYEGEPDPVLALFDHLLPLPGVAHFDIEASRHKGWAPVGTTASLILSLHDHRGRPADLNRRLLKMRATPGVGVIKLATTARSVRDNLELLDLVRDSDHPMMALAMGEHGLMSRVLAPKFNAFLTFASLRPETATAPGQPTLHDLLHLYRFRAITPVTRVYAVVGDPISHSLSPLVHNVVFEALGYDGVDLPLRIPGGDEAPESLKATLLELIHHPGLDFSGASITLPHKRAIVRLAREQGWSLDDASAALGAANTLVIDRGHPRTPAVRVLNTDAPAILRALEGSIDLTRSPLVGVVGAGGAARAAAWALARSGARVLIANRTPEHATALAADLSGQVRAITLAELVREPLDLVINATSVGMKGGPAPEAIPLDLHAIPFAPLVMETVYTPIETPLLALARSRGCRTIDGVAMFVEQAALQSEAWTGLTPPRALMNRVVREALAG